MAWKFIFHAVDYPDSDIRNEKEAGNIRFSEGKQFEGFFFFFWRSPVARYCTDRADGPSKLANQQLQREHHDHGWFSRITPVLQLLIRVCSVGKDVQGPTVQSRVRANRLWSNI